MIKIKWDKKISMTQKIFILIIVAWMSTSFILGILIGLIF